MSTSHCECHSACAETGPRRTRTIVTALLAIAIGAAMLFSGGVGISSGSTYTSNEAVTYREFGGTIRNTGAGWYVIDDAGHTPDEITIGTVTSTSVRVNYPTCDVITTVMVAVDDTYAQDFGLVVGASVGLSYLVMTGSVFDGSDSGYRPDVWNPQSDYSGSSNIWISGRCEVSP